MSAHDDKLREAGAEDCPDCAPGTRPAGHVGFHSKGLRPASTGPKRGPGRPPKRDTPPKAERRPQARSLEARIDGFIGGVGTMVAIFDDVCGPAIIAGSSDLASALDLLAKENPRIKQTLERALTGGAWTGVILAGAPIAGTIAAHHIGPLFGRKMAHPAQVVQMQEHRPDPRQEAEVAGWDEHFAQVDPAEVFA